MPQITDLNQLPGLNSLRRATNKGGLYRFLEFSAFRDVLCFVDDFNGDALDTNYWTVANSSGTSAADFATNLTQGAVTGTGAIQSDSGTTDNGATNLVGPIIYKGDNHVGMWARFSVDDVTSWSYEIGLIDAVPGSTGPGVSDVDTPAATASDCALLHMDTDQTLTTPAFVTKGSTANQTIKATSLSGFSIANATYCEVLIQLIGNDAYCHVAGPAGTTVGAATAMHNNRSAAANSAGFVEGGVALAPWFYNRTRNTTAKFMNVDAFAIWSYRTAQ